MIDDIIDISKIQSGSLEIKKENVEISSAIEQVIKELELEAKKKNIIIHHDVLCELYVKGDDIRIKQILSNFIKNSIKYSRES